MRRFPALDGLRAVAAILVIVFHYGGGPWGWTSGWIGVHIFFVLSGFLITTLALREEDRSPTGRISVKNFYLRRAFRILPVYFVVLGLNIALHVMRGDFRSSGLRDNLTYYFTFTNEFVDSPIAPFAQSWTLGIEQKFYLVWPLLAFVLCARFFARRLALSLTTIAVLVLTLLPAETNHESTGVHYIPLILGSLLAIVMHNPKGYALVSGLTKPVVVVIAAVAFLAAHWSLGPLFYWLSDGVLTLNDTYLVIIPAYSVVVTLLIPTLLAPGPLGWLLSTNVMKFIGDRSYSIYLVQGAAGVAVGALVPKLHTWPTLNWIGVGLVSLAIADLLFRYVEQPLIEVGRAVVNRSEKRAPAVAAEPERVPQPA
ncbi:acyltransferase family protein [Lentzea sp. JNUCC 0626]|uniref:acyltransferase family protein n=1 Tax=Lentzea sp. JNUCC 0626 TaxID=3367513 RepID=UPI003748046D